MSWTVTGSVWLNKVYIYNGSGAGSTTIPGIGVLEIANGRKVSQATANAAGTASASRFLPARLSGRTVNLQAIDDFGSLSAVSTTTIL